MHSMCTTVGREILPTASYDDMVQDMSPGIAAPTTLDVELLIPGYKQRPRLTQVCCLEVIVESRTQWLTSVLVATRNLRD